MNLPLVCSHIRHLVRRRHFVVGIYGLLVGLTVSPANSWAEPGPIPAFQPVFLPNEYAIEGWDQFFYFEDGSFLAASWLVTNLGIGSGRGAVTASFVTKKGKIYSLKNSRKKGDWSYSNDGLDLRIARHRLHSTPPNFHLSLLSNQFEAEITYNPNSRPWTPGRTWQGQKESEYQYIYTYAPSLQAQGKFRPGTKHRGPDEQDWTELKRGRGFAIRYVNSIGMNKIAESWIRLYGMESSQGPHLFLNLLGDPRKGSYSGQLAWQDEKAQYPIDSSVSITQFSPQDLKSGSLVLTVPKSVRFEASQQKVKVSGELRFIKHLHSYHLLDHLKGAQRFILSMLSAPVHVRYLVEYSLIVSSDDGPTRHTGQALADIILTDPR